MQIDKRKLALIHEVFSPSAPIDKRDLFFGRMDQLDRVVDSVNERGQHFALFGERGVGKTSLANVIHDDLRNVTVAKVTCDRKDTFTSIWSKALNQIQFNYERQGMGFAAQKHHDILQLDLFLKQHDDIGSEDVRKALLLVKNHLLFIFDEYDAKGVSLSLNLGFPNN